MNLNDNVVYRCRRLGPLDQLHPGRSRRSFRHNDRLHGIVSSVRSNEAARHRTERGSEHKIDSGSLRWLATVILRDA
jgi:hypothetical protein